MLASQICFFITLYLIDQLWMGLDALAVDHVLWSYFITYRCGCVRVNLKNL